MPPISGAKAVAAVKAAADFSVAGDALESLVREINAANQKSVAALKVVANELRDHLDAIDEEANVFWLAFAGHSRDSGEAYKKLGPWRAAFVVAKEVAELTQSPLAEHVAKAVFAQCGCVAKARSVSDAVDEMNDDWIAANVPEQGSPLTSPLHRALHRKRDFAGDKGWVAGWASLSGIAADHKIVPTDLAYQFYLERILLVQAA